MNRFGRGVLWWLARGRGWPDGGGSVTFRYRDPGGGRFTRQAAEGLVGQVCELNARGAGGVKTVVFGQVKVTRCEVVDGGVTLLITYRPVGEEERHVSDH